MDDEVEIDLGKYIMTLFRQWRLIISCALIPALFAGTFSLVSPKSYEASALVASSLALTQVSLGSAIQTTTEEQLAVGAQQSSALYDRQARLNSFIEMAYDARIAQEILSRFGNRLPPQDRSEAALLRMVSSERIEDTDSIRITVAAGDPILAAEIANAWSEAYVARVNDIYGGSASQGSYASVQAETQKARSDYDAAQAALVAFLKSNSIAENQRKVADLEGKLSGYYTDRQTELQQAYQELERVRLLGDRARQMQAQVQGGGYSALSSNAIALMLLKNEVYAPGGGPNLELQMAPGTSLANLMGAGITVEQMVNDLATLTQVLEAREEELNQQISQLLADFPDAEDATAASQTTSGPLSQSETLASIELQINQLQGQIEEEQGRQQALTQTRDLAWSAYANLATKETELRVAAQTGGVQVALASTAAVPDSDATSGMLNTLIAAVVGLLLGILAAFGVEFWQTRNGQEPHAILFPREKRGTAS